MKFKKWLIPIIMLSPVLVLGAPDITVPQNIENDTIYVSEANINPEAYPIGNSNIVISSGGIEAFSRKNTNYENVLGNTSTFISGSTSLNITKDTLSIGGKSLTNGLNVLIGKINTDGIIFPENISILPTANGINILSNTFNILAEQINIGNVFSLNNLLAQIKVNGNISEKLRLNTANQNGFIIQDGALTDRSIINPDLAGEVGTDRTIIDYSIFKTNFAPNSVQTNHIQDYATTNSKFAFSSVINDKIAFDTITRNLFDQNTITSNKIKDGSINEKKIDTSIQARINEKGHGRMAMQTIFPDGKVNWIKVCLRPKYPGEIAGGQVWNGIDPEWKRWGGPSCQWEDVKKTCAVCDPRTGVTRDTWQGVWNTKSEDSWQNCENLCPICQAKAPKEEYSGSCEDRTVTITTYTLEEGGNNYGKKGGACIYSEESKTLPAPEDCSPPEEPENPSDGDGDGNSSSSTDGGRGCYNNPYGGLHCYDFSSSFASTTYPAPGNPLITSSASSRSSYGVSYPRSSAASSSFGVKYP